MDRKKKSISQICPAFLLPPEIFRVWGGTVFMIKADCKVGKVALTSVLGLDLHCLDQTIHVISSPLRCVSSFPQPSEGLSVQCCDRPLQSTRPLAS